MISKHALLAVGACVAMALQTTARAQGNPAPEAPADGDDFHGEIVVTATGLNRLDVIAGTSVLAGDDLQRSLDGQIGEVLSQLPGVSATSFSPGASRPVLRGFQGDRVRVLVDGIGSIDASNTSTDHAVTIDPLTAQKIEVLRGPAVLLYGSSAIGGAVNVIDKRIPLRVPGEPVHLDGYLAADTAYDLREGGASLDIPLAKQWAFHLDGSWRQTRDVEIPGYQLTAMLRGQLLDRAGTLPPDEAAALREVANQRGILPGSATETKSAGAGLAWIGSGGSLGVSAGWYDTTYGVPTMPGGGEDEPVTIGLDQKRFDLRGSLDLDGSPFAQVTTRWGYSDYTHTEFEGTTPGTTFLVEGVEGRVELVQRERGGWRGSLGGQYMFRDFNAIGAEAFVPRNKTGQWALFTLQEVERGPFEVEFGGRYEHTGIETPTAVRSFGTLSGALGLSWTTAGGLRLGINGTRAERAPTAEELFADGPHLATQQYELGNPALGTESAWGLEGYVRGDIGPAEVQLAVYRNWFDHFVFLADTGGLIDALPVYAQVQGQVDWFGVEGEASLPLYQTEAFTLVGDLRGDYVRASLAGGTPLPRIPPLSLLGGIEWQSDALDLRAELQWSARQGRIAAYETPTGAFTTANVSVAWKPIRGGNNLTIMLQGDNLFDVTGRRHASFTKDFVPLAGRNVKLSIRLSL